MLVKIDNSTIQPDTFHVMTSYALLGKLRFVIGALVGYITELLSLEVDFRIASVQSACPDRCAISWRSLQKRGALAKATRKEKK